MPRLYDIQNPTKGKRVFYDGIEGSQREIVIPPGGSAQVFLADHIAAELIATPNDLRLKVVPELEEADAYQQPPPPLEIVAPLPVDAGPKPICYVTGHRGIGDNIHQRGPVRELMTEFEVYLHTPAWMIYHDLIAKGLKLIFMPTNLHAQAKQIQREHGSYQWHRRPQSVSSQRRIIYGQVDVDRHGSIAQAMYATCGLQVPEKPDFSLPVPKEWRDKAKQRIATWNTGGKPLLIYRPITVRREWDATPRNPDVSAYHDLMYAIRDKFFVASIAHLRTGVEGIVGAEQPADVKIHDGSLGFDELAGLWAEADLLFCNGGFGPVLAQAVGSPCITIYGCETYRISERAGAHLAPTLGIDPDQPCDHLQVTRRHGCRKQITLQPAIERMKAFIDQHVRSSRPVEVIAPAPQPEPTAIPAEAIAQSRGGTLIFGTFYIDSPDRKNLAELWKKVHTTLNPDCDFLAVDSQSPEVKDCFAGWDHDSGTRHKFMYFNFPDNIGHLSRRNVTAGRDGWGRAFSKGLEIGMRLGYEHIVHIEGDSLFRLKVTEQTDRMRRENAACFSVPVRGFRGAIDHHQNWVETGLMMLSTDYLKSSGFISRYDWPNRRVAPTPEIVVRNILSNNLVMQPQWNAQRADKNQITKDNIAGLNLDWVTHQHASDQQDVYRKFAAMALGDPVDQQIIAGSGPAVAPVAVATPEPPAAASAAPSPLLKVNLGCGTNKLPGWLNHDADIDITKPLPWSDGAASHIFTEHCIEHVNHKQAIAFFKDAYRVLSPGGILRITVPSLEKIRHSDDLEYYKFTTKWQKIGPTKRGAMDAIIYAHGHEMIWCGALLEAALYFAGFDNIKQAMPGKSDHAELRGVEGHGKVIGDRFNNLESLAFDAVKQGVLPKPVSFAANGRRVAIVVGGSERWADDLETAKQFCATHGCAPEFFYINDHITNFRDGIAVTLHTDGNHLRRWLKDRRDAGLPNPPEVWAHKPSPSTGVSHWTEDWRGSSGLFAVAVALKKGHDRIILVGVPMDGNLNHFMRKQKWLACPSFRPGWEQKKKQIAPHVRSMSGGWTQETFGEPDASWLGTDAAQAAA